METIDLEKKELLQKIADLISEFEEENEVVTGCELLFDKEYYVYNGEKFVQSGVK